MSATRNPAPAESGDDLETDDTDPATGLDDDTPNGESDLSQEAGEGEEPDDSGDVADLALLVLDMIGPWTTPEQGLLLRQALGVTPRIVQLAARCRVAGVPVIHAHDPQGHWRRDTASRLAAAREAGGAAARVAEALAPQSEDYSVLKPWPSAFRATPLAVLLHSLGTRRVLVTGTTADQGVLATAMDAQEQGLQVVVPRDCVATPDAARTRRAVRHLEEALRVPTTPSPRFKLGRPRGRPVML